MIAFLSNLVFTEETSSNSSRLDSLKEFIKNPLFYIILSFVVFFFLLLLIIRRFGKTQPFFYTVIRNRKGKKRLVGGEKTSIYFVKPLFEKIVGSYPNRETLFSSSELYINDGPDKLYQISYDVTYLIKDFDNYSEIANCFTEMFQKYINNSLRQLHQAGKNYLLLNDALNNESEIIFLLNKQSDDLFVYICSFKIQSIRLISNEKTSNE